MAMQREELLMSAVARARPVFPSLSPRYLERYSLCGHRTLLMTWIIVRFMDLGIHQQELPPAESIPGDKVPTQKVSTYLGIVVSAATLTWSRPDLYLGHGNGQG